MPLDQETESLIHDILARYAARPGMSPEELRQNALALGRLLQGDAPKMASVRELAFPSGSGMIPMRAYFPGEAAKAALLWVHGGGFTTGGLDTHDTLCRRLAHQSGCVVFSIDYRLAPEHKFPAASDDSLAALTWIAKHAAELGIDPDRLALGGSSAGGNLAASAALRLSEVENVRIRHLLLVYPAVDATMSNDTFVKHADGYQLTSAMMAGYWRHYMPPTVDPKNPHLSPIWAEDLSGFPPTHLIVAELDPLQGEVEEFGKRLSGQGVPLTLTRFDGVMHGFFAQAGVLSKARAAQKIACEILARDLQD